VAKGDADVGVLVLACPWEARSMTVAELLSCQRRWGASRTRKVLALLQISERKSLGSMTDRQRRVLSTLLGSSEQDRV
jgi:hypothetical protein